MIEDDREKPAALPSGTVTFLFTDIEGSTERWERDRAAMAEAVARHDRLVRPAIVANDGHVFKTVGDAFCAVFATAPDAVAAALAAQRAIAAEGWDAVGGLRVRMALHTGNADERGGDYFGPAVNRVARLLAIGHGGQVLVSGVTTDLVQGQMPPQATLRDLGQHRLKDLIYPEQVYQLFAPDLPRDFPALRSLDALPNNLPLQVTSFVGRETEVAEIAALVHKARLVTLVGAGGVGKTRTSLQVGANLLDGSGDGVWFVELAPLTDAALVPSAIALALDIRLPSDGDAVDALAKALKNRDLLLILDNCEHLVDAAARSIDAIIRTAPRVNVLASSRQGLGIAGEATYRMPSLAVPDAATAETLRASDAVAYGAIALFVARAEAADARFTLTDEATPVVADICRRLDGIPLAIELAAARVKLLNPSQIRQRLDERFRVLTGGNRTALPRQQTLRALIDWSYDLLDERERALFRRVGVFLDGFAIEGAAAVGCDESLDELDCFDVLASLVDKSLVVPDMVGDAPRYRLLESTRAYAREKLDLAAETERCEERRFAYLLERSERAQTAYETSAREASLLELRVDLEDVRAAIEWAVASGAPERAAQLATSSDILYGLFLIVELQTTAQRLHALLPPAEVRLRGRLSFQLALAADRSNRPRESLEFAEAAIADAKASGDGQLLSKTLGLQAVALGRLGRLSEATSALEEAETCAPLTALRRMLILNARAMLVSYSGDLETAIRYDEQLRAAHRTSGNKSMEFVSTLNLGEDLHAAGQSTRAIDVVRDAIERSRPFVGRGMLGNALANLAAYECATGEIVAAGKSIGEALRVLLKHLPEAANFAQLFLYVATVASFDGDDDAALEAFAYSERLREERGAVYEATELDARERFLQRIEGRRTADERAALEARGAAWNFDDAIAFAFRVCDAERPPRFDAAANVADAHPVTRVN